MNEKTCETCKYFVQHYRKDGEKYHYVHCGHCTGKLVKKRRDDDPACDIYEKHIKK